MSENIKRLKQAIEQIDEAQPLCPSPGCDSLADAAMSIDLVVSEKFIKGAKELRAKGATSEQLGYATMLMRACDLIESQVRQLKTTSERNELREQLQQYQKRIDKMKVGSLNPETILNGYKVCVEALQKRKEELFQQLATKDKHLKERGKKLKETRLRLRELSNELEEWRDKEGSACPEDVGFVEYIKVKDKEIDRLNELIFAYESVQAPVNPLIAEVERLKDALTRLQVWANEYPLGVFPKPDLKKAARLLKTYNMTLDAITADTIRQVLDDVKDIVEKALKGE